MLKTVLAAAMFALAPRAIAGTEVFIGVSGGPEIKKTGLAMAQFHPARPQSPEDLALAEVFREIIRADLLYSRYFDIKEDALSPANLEISKESLAWWKGLAGHLITGKARDAGDIWTFTATLYDLSTGKKLTEKFYQGEKRALRRAAHMFSDDVVLRLTGRQGIAHSKLAFSNNATGRKEIWIADYDGENLTRLTSDNSINLLPRWSTDGTRIYYTTYRYGNPDMFEIDRTAGKIKPFTTFQGLNIPGGFSPDGMTMAMTLSRGEDPGIYTLDIVTKKVKRLLKNFGVSSSPTWSPDGTQVAFVSDRAGNPQLHVLEIATGKTRRLTRFNWCDSPSWSPSGEWIVFAGRETRKEKLNIFITDLTGSQIRRLTSDAGDNEDPSWSPDGRFVAFTSNRRGKREIFLMDADGSAPHPLTEMKGNSFTPNWSP
jgi:TolB protein